MNEPRKKDLRVVKTERAIYRALIELLQKKELEKITVSELAELAEINKATFYLHYADIYTLYQDALARHISEMIDELGLLDHMLNDPEEFARRLVCDFFNPAKMSKDPFFHDRNYVHNRTISWHICNAFTDRAIACDIIPETRENILKLEFFFTGIAFLRHDHSADDNEMIIQVIADNIRNSFGDRLLK